MVDSNENMNKICSLYVSDWHLITMLIPYLKEKLEKGIKIETFFERSLKENINTLLKKIILNQENKDKITSINWNKTIICNEHIENKLMNTSIAIVAGSDEYIKIINKIIDKSKKNITIINCFEVSQYNENIKEILKNHKFILNTSGEKKIEDVFETYVS